MLELRGISLAAAGRKILDVEALTLQCGSITAIIGRNGAGKSSLVRAIGLLVPAQFEHYAFAGQSLPLGKDSLEIRRQMSHVYQTPRLLSGSVLYNVALPLRLRGMDKGVAEQEAHRWLEILQAAHLAERNPRSLSGGEAARVGLARAFVVKPKLTLLDEPFSSLDVESKMHVYRNLRRWLKLAQSTAIMVSHDFVEVEYLADRLLVMDDGKIVADGKPAQILEQSDLPFVRDFAALGGTRGNRR